MPYSFRSSRPLHRPDVPLQLSASYSTLFPDGEFQNGLWALGGTDGLVFTNPTTGLNTAYGTQSAGSGNTDDSLAVLKQTFAANQYARAVVFNDGTLGGNTYEVELLLRARLTANSFLAYECNLAFDGGYAQIVRLDGPLNAFTYVNSGGGLGAAPATGDLFEAQIVGNIVTMWVTHDFGSGPVRTQVNTGDVSSIGTVYTIGNPGVGFWHGNNQRHYGFTSFAASQL